MEYNGKERSSDRVARATKNKEQRGSSKTAKPGCNKNLPSLSEPKVFSNVYWDFFHVIDQRLLYLHSSLFQVGILNAIILYLVIIV